MATPNSALQGADDILIKIRDVLHDSQELIDHCTNLYNKRHVVYLGVDVDNVPRPKDFPLIIIYNIERDEKKQNAREVSFSININFSIIQKGITYHPSQETYSKKTYDGTHEVELFRKLGEKVLLVSQLANRTEVIGDTMKADIYPLFRSDTTLTLTFTVSLRTGIAHQI